MEKVAEQPDTCGDPVFPNSRDEQGYTFGEKGFSEDQGSL